MASIGSMMAESEAFRPDLAEKNVCTGRAVTQEMHLKGRVGLPRFGLGRWSFPIQVNSSLFFFAIRMVYLAVGLFPQLRIS